MPQILKLTSTNTKKVLAQTANTLRAGGLTVFPSDTVYGLLADATNPEAVAKLLKFKNRQPGKAISIFVSDRKMAERYVNLTENSLNVIKNLLPGPFTVICQSKHLADRRLEAENGTLAFRLPDFPLINQLTNILTVPVTATSANLSATPPHYSITTLLSSLSPAKKALLDLIIDAGKLPTRKPSTVIDTTGDQLTTYRIGDLFPSSDHSLVTASVSQTKALARYVLVRVRGKAAIDKPIVFLLRGSLGAGKTHFTKGLAQALGITTEVVSPTYVISYEYPFVKDIFDDYSRANQVSGKLVHYDLYRLDSLKDLAEIGLLDSLPAENIYAVEWPERLSASQITYLKHVAEIVFIDIKTIAENKREISWRFS